jgi:type IX secretion system PorP/SprF family membrane protein
MFISTGNRYRICAIMLMIFLAGWESVAQDRLFFNQHLHNRMLYNPAFAGDRSIPGFTFLTRQQWMSWEGSPASSLLAAHTRLKDKNAGAGVSLFYDRMGPVYDAGFGGCYSYTLQLGEDQRLSLGLQGELMIRQIELTRLRLVDQGDPLFSEDPGLRTRPNFGLGMAYRTGRYTLSVSMPRILNSALSPFEGETSRWSRSARALYMGAASFFDLNGAFRAEPSLLVVLARGDSPFIELSADLYYRESFGWGVLYRFDRTLGGRISYRYRELLLVGYSYDLSLGIAGYNTGTHELFLGYNFPFNKTKTLSPRRF